MRKRNIKPIILTFLPTFLLVTLLTPLTIFTLQSPSSPISSISSTLNYEETYAHLEQFFKSNGALGEDGFIEIPTDDGTVITKTLAEVTEDFLATGELNYTKGIRDQYMEYLAKTIDLDTFKAQVADGGTGWDASAFLDPSDTSSVNPLAIGDTCLNGDINGDASVDNIDFSMLNSYVFFVNTEIIQPTPPPGCMALASATEYITAVDPIFEVNGGTLSMKPCAVDEILVTGSGSTWECATVSSLGVQNTTNTSAALAMNGTELTASITDSAGNTVTTPALDLGSTFVSNTTMTSALADYALAADLTSLTGRVTTLETNAANYATKTELGGYYQKSQTYSQTEVNDLLSDKQTTLPSCNDGQVVKYSTTSSSWTCAADNAGAGATDLTGYATENWVDQNYATKTALSSLLVSNLVSGVGIDLVNNNGVITVNSTAATDVFEVVNDHGTVATPNTNRIYIDTATNPDSQWIYSGTTWQQVGEVNADLAGYYTTAQTDSAISTAITANNQTYTTTTTLTSLLAAKQDKLPNCAAGQVLKYSLSAPNWTCAMDNDTTYNLADYVTQSHLTSQNYITSASLASYYNQTQTDSAISTAISASNANYTTTANLTNLLAAKQDKLPNCAANQVVKYSLTTPNWQCANDNNTTYDLSTYATQGWVNQQNFASSAALANYYTKTDIDGMNLVTSDRTGGYQIQVVDTIPGSQTNGVLYFVRTEP